MSGAHVIDIGIGLAIRNLPTPEVTRKKRAFSSTSLAPSIRERVYRDWLRGVTERTLSAMNRITREGIENLCREQARADRAAAFQARIERGAAERIAA